MSTQVLPSLAGLDINIGREVVFSNNIQIAVSGKENRIAYWPYPRYRWTLQFNLLRSAAAYTELQQLVGFFNSRQGRFDTFLYQDSDDNTVTGQAIGTGDGSTKTFQLIRTFGGFIDPILAPNVVSHVYNNGVDGGGWTISNWGAATPGVITYGTAPVAGHAITADFTYYWPVRMDDDKLGLNRFVSQFYEAKKFTFISVFN